MKRFYIIFIIVLVCFVSCANNTGSPEISIDDSPVNKFDSDSIGRLNNSTDDNLKVLDGRRMTRNSESSSNKGIIGIFTERVITGKEFTPGYKIEYFIYTFKVDGTYNIGYSYQYWVGNGYDGASMTSVKRGTYNLYNYFGLYYITMDDSLSYRYLVSEKFLVLISDTGVTYEKPSFDISVLDYTDDDIIPDGLDLFSTSYRGIVGAWVKLSDPVPYINKNGEEDCYFPDDYLFELSIDGDFHFVNIQEYLEDGILKSREEVLWGTYQVEKDVQNIHRIRMITEHGKELTSIYKVSSSSLWIQEPLKNLFSFATVTFISEFADVPDSLQVTLNTKLGYESFPILSDSKNDFLGWYINEEKITFPVIVNDDIIVEAKWEPKCKVTFQTDYCEAPESFYISRGTLFPKEHIPNIDSFYKSDIAFLGWFVDDVEFVFSDCIVENDLTIVAKWVTDEEFFEIADKKKKEYRFSKKLEGIWILNGEDSSCRLEIKKNLINNDFNLSLFYENENVYEEGKLFFIDGISLSTALGYVLKKTYLVYGGRFNIYGYSLRLDIDSQCRLYLQMNSPTSKDNYDLEPVLVKYAKLFEEKNIDSSTDFFPSRFTNAKCKYFFEKTTTTE